MEMNFHSHANKTHFYMKRLCTWPHFESEGFGTRKWPIADDKRSPQSLNLQARVPRKPISANRGLNLANRGIHFVPRLDTVPESMINLNLGIN